MNLPTLPPGIPENPSTIVARKIVTSALRINRFAIGLQNRLVDQLIENQQDVVDQIEKLLRRPGEWPKTTYRKLARLGAAFEQLDETLTQYYGNAESDLRENLMKLLRDETDPKKMGIAVRDANAAINNALLGDGYKGASVSSVAIPGSVANVLLQDGMIASGDRLSDIFTKLKAGLSQSVQQAVRLGIYQGDSIDEIMARVRRVVPLSRKQSDRKSVRDIKATVRTAVNSVSNQATLYVYKENEFVSGVQLIVTLDSRTSKNCIGRAGRRWKYSKNRELIPVNHSVPFGNGPPFHYYCRTTVAATFVGDRSLEARVARRIPERKRKSMAGLVPSKWGYEKWLKSLPDDERRSVGRSVLGPKTYELWESKRFPLSKLINNDGDPLKYSELLEEFG